MADVLPTIGGDSGPVEATPVVVFKADGTAIDVFTGGAVTVADGADVALGAKADAAVTDPTASGNLIALAKGWLTGLGQKADAAWTFRQRVPSLRLLKAIAGGGGSASLTDASVTSATGASQTVAAANAARRVLNITNPGTASWWINESGGTAVANGAGCFELPPSGRWTPSPAPTNIVKGIGTAAAALTVAVA
jgi:hypothetical protein